MTGRRTLVTVSLILVAAAWPSSSVWAQDPIHKAGRGLVNVLTGWIEIPKQVHRGSQDSNSVTGLGRGLLKGAALTILRTGVGVYETVTFPIAYPKDYASPYEPMELPDYAWE